MLVIEAGNNHVNDTKVGCPGIFASMYGDQEYDWNYVNAPQVSQIPSLSSANYFSGCTR